MKANMPRFLLLATLALTLCAAAAPSYAQRAMAHPLPRAAAAKPATPTTAHPHVKPSIR